MNVFDVLREKLTESANIDIGHHFSVEHNVAIRTADAIEVVNQVEEEYEPKTNADRIRSMTDEELAEFIANDCLEIADDICGSCTQETQRTVVLNVARIILLVG